MYALNTSTVNVPINDYHLPSTHIANMWRRMPRPRPPAAGARGVRRPRVLLPCDLACMYRFVPLRPAAMFPGARDDESPRVISPSNNWTVERGTHSHVNIWFHLFYFLYFSLCWRILFEAFLSHWLIGKNKINNWWSQLDVGGWRWQ